MIDVKISALPAATTVGTADVLPIVQGGTTKKVPPNFTNPTIVTGILDTNGNTILGFSPVASAVNFLDVQNQSAGNPAIVTLDAAGASANVSLKLIPKGTGTVSVHNTFTDISVLPSRIDVDVGLGAGMTVGTGATLDTPMTLQGAATGTGNKATFDLSKIPASTLRTATFLDSDCVLETPLPKTQNDYLGSFTVPDTGNMAQPDQLTLSNSKVLTLKGSATVKMFDSLNSPPAKGSFSPGSFILKPGEYLLQFRKLVLNGNQIVTLLGDALIQLFDLTPPGQLVLTGLAN